MIDVKKLKVTELREELKSRGLDTKGNKAALVKRLEKALKAGDDLSTNESFTESQDSSVLETTASDEHDESFNQAEESPIKNVAEPEISEKTQPVEESSEPPEDLDQDVGDPAVRDMHEEVTDDAVPLETDSQQVPQSGFSEAASESSEPEISEPMEVPEVPEKTDVKVDPEEALNKEEAVGVLEESSTPEIKEQVKEEVNEVVPELNQEVVKEEKMECTDSMEIKEEKPELKESDMTMESTDIKVTVKEEESKETEQEVTSEPVNGYQVMDSVGDTEDTQDKEDRVSERKRKRSRSRSRERQRSRRSRSPRRRRSRSYDRDRRSGSKERQRDRPYHRERSRSSERSRHRDRSRSRERTHHRDRSRSRERRHQRDRSRSPQTKSQKVSPEDSWVTSTTVQWDRYNCDLNIRVSDDGYKCNPITVEGFAFMWAGARSNYGFKTGKLAYECKVLENLNVNHLPEEETSRHVVRVGFSTGSTSMQLGEEKLSYGYGGTAKASTECKFKDYGETFTEGDVITAYVDFEGDKVEISFSKNEKDLGVCFSIEKEDLGDMALFPHILTKNCEITTNFGQRESPFFPLKEGFKFVGEAEESEKVRGALPPESKGDCEAMMMVGLPGAGKTTWVEKFVQEHRDKHYEVLGTNNIIDKMKVMGLPRKRNYAGRWDSLIDKSTKCLNRLLEIASKKKRSYIIDQTNVYFSARRRKMRSFEGFQRKAVVVLPEDEEYKRRCGKQEKDEGKDVPDTAVWEMKANFKLPEVGEVFDKVEYVEVGKQAAEELVAKYNKDGEQNLPPDYWQNRFNRDHNRGGGYGGGGGRYGGDRRDYNDRDRGNYRNRGGGGGRYDNRDRDRGSGRGGWRGNQGNYYGYSSNDRQKSGSYDSYGNRDNYRQDYGNKNVQNYNSGGGGYGNNSGYGNSGSNQGGWNNQQGGWGNQGGWSNQQQNTWGNQQQGAWGNQTYNWSTGQWGYGQQQQPQQQQQQAGQASQQGWGQGYNYYQYPQQSGWGNYNYNYQQQQPQQPEQK